jgi:hypothetical protein
MSKDRLYNNSDLMPRDWMLAVMHDPHVSLITRIDTAARLLKLDTDAGLVDSHPYDREVRLIIKIEGLGNNPPELIEREPEVKVKIH